MPTETFNTEYTAVDNASGVINTIIASVKSLDAATTSCKANLKNFADAGATSLNKLQSAATAADASLTKIQGSITQAVTASNSMTASVQSLVAQLGTLVTALNQANTAAGQAATSVKSAGSAAGSSGTSFLESRAKLMLFGATLAEVTGLIHAFAEGAEKARQEVIGFGEANTKLREGAREVSGIQGFEGPTDVPVAQIMKIAVASGMTPAEATALSTEYENSASTGRAKGNILGVVGENGLTKEKQRDFEEQIKSDVATFALSKGMDPKTAGDVLGTASTYQKFTGREQVAGMLGGIAYGLDEARGNISTLAKSELAVAGSAVNSGHIKDLVDASAYVGVASISAKSAAGTGTAVRQLDSLLNKQRGEGGYDYLERIGATKQTDDLERLRLVRADALKNSGGDLVGYLNQQGFSSQQERNVTASFITQFPILEERIRKGREIAKDGIAVLERNEAFKKTDLGRARLAKANLAEAQFGRGEEIKELLAADESSAGDLVRDHKIATEDEGRWSSAGDFLHNTLGILPRAFGLRSGLSQRERLIRTKTFSDLRKQLHTRGLIESDEDIANRDVREGLPPKANALAQEFGTSFLSADFTEDAGRIFKGLSGKLNDKGGGNAEAKAALDKIVENGNKANQLQEELVRLFFARGGFAQGAIIPRR